MIVKMSKVEIVGPKGLLHETLDIVRGLGIFQIEPSAVGFVDQDLKENIRSYYPEKKAALEKLYLQELLLKTDELLALLPQGRFRTSYLEPHSVIDVLAKTVDRHISNAKDSLAKVESLQKERQETEHYTIFLREMASLIGSTAETPDIDYIGLTIREPAMVDRLKDLISRITDWKFEFTTRTAADGKLIGLIMVEKGLSGPLKKALSEEQVPELSFPESFGRMSFAEKLVYVNRRLEEISTELSRLNSEMELLAARWVPIYMRVREWLQDRLSLLTATASAFETRMCFFINGWLPSKDLERLRKKTDEVFGSKVVIEEKEMMEEDLDRVPIVLKNSPYFRPFEIFTRVLPLPAYTSYDPTPFIGLFFPLFFGIILGDAGYGVVLLILSLVLMKKFPGKELVRDAGRVLFASSLYTIFFGTLYGEFFGDLPHRLFGLEPICIERRTAIVPMICFALAVGVAHVFLGLILGAIGALRKKEKKEALYKLLSIVVICCIAAVAASMAGFFPSVITRPIIIVILFLCPLLFFAGGLLAPLELLKSIGNIISYVRIMAIGLTSVLLAFVANRLAGLTGDIVTGVFVAGMLHILNIVLGVFSPTIHALRLHYVEFFGKFIEHGGRKFEPLITEKRKEDLWKKY